MNRIVHVLLVLCIFSSGVFAQAVVFDYSKLYEASSPAVVQVTTEDGSGSGFLVSPFGHIATNFHVVRGSRYLAVQFPNGRKVKAAIVALNPHYDMAVLKVNSEVVADIKPLSLLSEEQDASVKVGVPVVAIGSPLNQKFLMTQGILSKVDETTVLGDFLLQSGNSGGPLLNLQGEVIGINTFGEANISGAIRVDALRDFLTSPELIGESVPIEPPGEQLRSISSMRYPVDVLNHKIETDPLDLGAYKINAGNFHITAITPVLIGKLQVMQERKRASNRQQRRGSNISDSSRPIEEPYYEWHRSTETSLDYAITFDIRPDSGLTKSSSASKFLWPMSLFGRGGRREIEFKGEFLDFRIFRDGTLIEPIMPGRQVIEANSEQKKTRFVDQAYAGSYTYSPDEFLSGDEFKIQIIDARHPNSVHKELIFRSDSKLIQQLRADFTFAPAVLITKTP